MFRRRRRQNQEGSEPGDQGSRYLLREKLLSIGDDFWIENDRGERVFRVDAKVLRVRDTVYIKDTDGTELIKLQKRLLRARNTMAIERGDERVATVRKAIIDPLRDRFTIDLASGGSMQAQGNILDHEYQITRDGIPVANISKRWFRVRESYGVASDRARTTCSSSRWQFASTTSPTDRPVGASAVAVVGGRRRNHLHRGMPGRPKSTLYSCRSARCSCILVPAVPTRRACSRDLLCN
jgi:uncharacterized protein YxjI